MQRTSWPIWAIFGSLLLVVLAMACSNAEDKAFRAAVAPVVARVATLEWLSGEPIIYGLDDETRQEIESFESAVEHLPPTGDRNLRYLSIRLDDLATRGKLLWWSHNSAARATEYATSRVWSDKMRASLDERVSSAEANVRVTTGLFEDAYVLTAAAERVCLGTSRLWDKKSNPGPAPSDSVLNAATARVRHDLSQLR